MKQLITICFFFAAAFRSQAQIQTESPFPDIKNKKGSLIAVNEMHGAIANTQVYLDMLKHIHEQLPGDTISLFLEIPFSQSIWCNNFLTSGGKIAMLKGAYPSDEFWNGIVAQQIPVKVFGCDFEYDEQFKRNKSLLYLLQKTSDDLADAKQDTTSIAVYISLVKDFKLKASDTRGLISQLEETEKVVSPELKAEIDQLLFALAAPQKYSSGRDKFIYTRALQGIELGYLRYQNRINVLIHGSAHINPTYQNALFNRFRSDGESPFAGKCFLLGNVYLDCKNNSGIFQHETISSYSFYALAKDDSPIINYFKALPLTPHNVYFRPAPKSEELVFPGLKQEEILGLYVHKSIDN